MNIIVLVIIAGALAFAWFAGVAARDRNMPVCFTLSLIALALMLCSVRNMPL